MLSTCYTLSRKGTLLLILQTNIIFLSSNTSNVTHFVGKNLFDPQVIYKVKKRGFRRIIYVVKMSIFSFFFCSGDRQ